MYVIGLRVPLQYSFVCSNGLYIGGAGEFVHLSPGGCLFLRLEWLGMIFLSPAYYHLSDAILVTTGRPSRGRRRLVVRLLYFISGILILLLASGYLLGPMVMMQSLRLLPAHALDGNLYCILRGHHGAGVDQFWAGLSSDADPFRTQANGLPVGGGRCPGAWFVPLSSVWFQPGSQLSFSILGNGNSQQFVCRRTYNCMAYAVAFFGVSWPDRV